MYNPQVTSTKNDIEQGRKDAYQSNTGNVVDHATVSPSVPAVNYPVVGVTFCCCDTRQVFFQYEQTHRMKKFSNESRFPNR